jgi:hypothetical protein|nr:MAG TPA: hypothetical protein [Caudoviricetes sp.]
MRLYSLKGKQKISIEFITENGTEVTENTHYDTIEKLIDIINNASDIYHRLYFILDCVNYNEYEEFENPNYFEFEFECTGKMTEEDWEKDNLIDIDTDKVHDDIIEKFDNEFSGETIVGMGIIVDAQKDEIESWDIVDEDYL